MSHSIPKRIELNGKFNKVIRAGKSQKNVIITGEGARDASLRVGIDGKWLDKPIQVYRMWYRFLQLALELEEQKVHILTKMVKTELKKPKKDKWGKLQKFEMLPVKHRVKVNKKKYKGWDIDSIPTTSFDSWWFGDKNNYPAHRELFLPEHSISVLKDRDEWIEDSKYTYIRVDNRRRIKEIESDVRNFFVNQRTKGKLPETDSVSDFPIFGNPNINTLINRYNAIILILTSDMKHKEMLASNIFRSTQSDMGDNETDIAYTYGGSAGRAMRDLILPSKIALLSVCDGCFVQNPTKDYL
jgi:hypothetical protein